MGSIAPVSDITPVALKESGQVNTSGVPLGRVRNRGAREQALISAATRLFASRGYDATTTREIAAEAGCAEGLIHRYFEGKEGLLLAIIRSRTSREFVDMNQRLRLAGNLKQEIVQLVEFELERMWEEREFLRVLIPRALLDSSLGRVLSRIGPAQRARTIIERLKALCSGKTISDAELEAIANFIGVVGFMFGFMRPVVLGDDRMRSKEMALSMARMLGSTV